MREPRVVVGVCAGLCLAVACGVDESVVATVGDQTIEVSSVQDHLVAATGEPWQGVTDPVASRLLDQFLDQAVVLVAASRDREADAPSEPGARTARVRKLLEELCGPAPPPSRERVESAIAEARSVERPARAHVRQMLLSSREEAESARRQLDQGADFVELSRRVSRAPNADGGGELGLLTQGGLSDNLDEVIFALEKGEISEPVPGPSGYHIFQVLEIYPAGPPARDEIEPEVTSRLREISAREHAETCIGRLADEVDVKVIPDRLWFDYDGRYAEVLHGS